jgi:hypothetical protein
MEQATQFPENSNELSAEQAEKFWFQDNTTRSKKQVFSLD